MVMSPPKKQDVRLEALVAAYGIPGTLLDPPDEPLDDASWRALLRTVREQRLCGLLARTISDEALPATPEQVHEALELAAASAATAVIVERSLIDAAGVLDRAGIDYRVLKGASLAHTAYPDPALREFGDVDFLFLSHVLNDAVDVLCAAGAHRRNAELRPNFDARFAQGTTLIDRFGIELDLHRTFVDGPYGQTLDAADVFDHTTAFSVGGRELLGLGLEERLVHVCVHAALGSRRPRLVPLRDVAQLVLEGDVELQRVQRLASRAGLEPVVARAVALAWTTFALADITALSRWALSFEPTEDERRLVDLYVGDDPSWGARAVQSARRVHGVRAKAAYLRAVAFPEDEALSELGRSRRGWWQRGMRLVFRSGHRQQ